MLPYITEVTEHLVTVPRGDHADLYATYRRCSGLYDPTCSDHYFDSVHADCSGDHFVAIFPYFCLWIGYLFRRVLLLLSGDTIQELGRN